MKKAITILLLAIIMVTVSVPVQAHARTVTYKSMTVKVDKAKGTEQYNANVYWNGKQVATYKFDRKPTIKFTTPRHLTYGKLASRKGRVLYIEILVGRVLDDEKNGKVLNCNPKFNYISYWYTPYRKGDRVRTYCVYNPYNNAEDDIHKRFDERME